MFNHRYDYDKAGNLIQSADQRSGVLNYVYDKIGRIQEARNSQTGRSETFAFDPAYNILDIPTSTPYLVGEGWGEGKMTAPISDDTKTQGRLKSPAKPNLTDGNRLESYNGIEYTYDALGNLIYRQLPNGENQYYQYDLENQLVRAEIKKAAGNTEIWTYAYDPFGRRLSKERQDKLAWTSTDPKRPPTSSGTEHDYFRSTPTKAATPISTPTKTATNRWRKSLTTPKTKPNISPISTTTKSAYRAR